MQTYGWKFHRIWETHAWICFYPYNVKKLLRGIIATIQQNSILIAIIVALFIYNCICYLLADILARLFNFQYLANKMYKLAPLDSIFGLICNFVNYFFELKFYTVFS